jgi:hypothetical protein
MVRTTVVDNTGVSADHHNVIFLLINDRPAHRGPLLDG